VHTSKINGQFIVDEHPNVIISLELKILCSLVAESSREFESESKIVVLPVVTESSKIYWEEVLIVVFVNQTVASVSVAQVHRDREWDVEARGINIPPSKLGWILDAVESSR